MNADEKVHATAVELVRDCERLREQIAAREPDRVCVVEKALEHARFVESLARKPLGQWEMALAISRLTKALALADGLMGGVN